MLITVRSRAACFFGFITISVSVDIPLWEMARSILLLRFTLEPYIVVMEGLNLETIMPPITSTRYLEIGGRVIACASGNRCDIRNTTAFEFFGDSRYNLLIIDHYLSDDIGSRQKLVEHYRHIISPAIIMSPCLIIVYNFCFVKRIAAKENYHYAKKEPCPPAIFDKNIQNPAKHTFDLLRPPQFFWQVLPKAPYIC